MVRSKYASDAKSLTEVTPHFDALRISIASPEQIRSWSYGEVKRPETINYRTFKPERDGLFCARIFGPVKDDECLCGKYKRIKFRGIVCEKCGVEVTQSRVRRERMGHIELASPVAHIWFTKSLPSRIGTLLDLTMKNLDRVLYFEAYVVIDPGFTPLSKGQLLSEEEYVEAQDTHGEETFTALTGGAALKKMLKEIDLEAMHKELSDELVGLSSEIRRKKLVKRLKIVKAFLTSKTRPEWMVLDVLPVIPPELRPLVPLDGGRFATADLNDLYRRLINRNNRLKKLYELKAPTIIVRNEERMLQEIADALLDNSRRGRPVVGANKRPLKSLSEALKGKQGRFRQNLLGKRVDYSGRSVIVVGPYLKLNQCGIPKKMALELFRPFVYQRLEKYGLVPTVKIAKRFVEKERPEVWDVLEEVVKDHPVLLNRAPTLHRLSIQAFEPVLVEGKAIQLHPLVCKAFNADFDGDTMSVHVPISVESQLETRVLMMSTHNILSPADGSPMIIPSKDMVLGLYYLTLAGNPLHDEHCYGSWGEIEHALFGKHITLHTPIRARIQHPEEGSRIVETTAGRLTVYNATPKHKNISFDAVNKPLTVGDIGKLIEQVYRFCGQEKTVEFADKLMALGFEHSTNSGVSFGKSDLVVPEEKESFVQDTWKQVHEYRQQYLDGLITQGERFNKITDAWGDCTTKVSEAMLKKLSSKQTPDEMNAIYMMAHSGARGSAAQMRQLAAMRGLITRHSGDFLEYPITSNFAEGLKGFEYFNSTHGSRKGLSDTALKTANSGYLTRRLVDVAQDCIISVPDCGTEEGIYVRAVVEGGTVVSSLEERISGRVLAETLTQEDGTVIVEVGTLVSEDVLSKINLSHITEIKIRSVLKCEAERGLCAKCYGQDLTRSNLVSIGEAVGVVAAQSIGEPGTQLTLRTFHLGGAGQKSTEASELLSSHDGTVTYDKSDIVKDGQGKTIVIARSMLLTIQDSKGKERARHDVPHGACLAIQSGSVIKKGAKLAEWNSYAVPIVTEKTGIVRFVDLREGLSFKEIADEATGVSKKIVTDWRQSSRGDSLKPRLVICDDKGDILKLDNGMEARYFLSSDAVLNISDGQKVHCGDIIAQLPRESTKNRDITGGLPRIVELVEARRPKDPSLICECAGTVEFGKEYKSKRALIIKPDEENAEPVEYLVPRSKHILVQEGEHVKVGEVLVDGSPVLQDILRVLGVEMLAEYLIKEIQDVYRLQGVRINDKHLEIIARQMLQKLEITDPGDTLYLTGDHVDLRIFEALNKKMLDAGKKPARGIRVLQGITRASLQTESFISAASFQETTRVLTEAAIWGKVDRLRGLKESVIVGHLPLVGTGWLTNQLKNEAFVPQSVQEGDDSAQRARG